MSNSQLLEEAFRIYKSNWKYLTLVAFIAVLFWIANSSINSAIRSLTEFTILAEAINFIISIFIYPIFTLGVYYVYLETWRGKKPKISGIFHLYSSKKLLLNALLLGFIIRSISRISLLPSNMTEIFAENLLLFFLTHLMSLTFLIIWTWLSFRLTLASYLYNIKYSANPIIVIKESYKRMKGNAGRLLLLYISVWWWRVLALVMPTMILMVLTIFMILFGMDLNIGEIIPHIIFPLTAIIASLLAPYPLVVSAGFADGLIPSEKYMRKIQNNLEQK